MFDFRETKTIELKECQATSDGANSYFYTEKISGRKYILKLYQDLHPDTEIYLISEFRKLVRLSSEPEIGNVYGLVTVQENGNFYPGYLMEYIEGATLENFLVDRELDYGTYFRILKDIANGLSKCHHYEVNHNDLNFDNIMIDSFGNVKLIDFYYDVELVEPENRNNLDIKYFKKVEERLFKHISGNYIKRCSFVKRTIEVMQNFHELNEILPIIDFFSYDLSLLEENALQLLVNIAGEFTDFKMDHVLVEEDINIPEWIIPSLSKAELGHLQKIKDGTKLHYLDSRLERLHHNLVNYWNPTFRQLTNTGFLGFEFHERSAQTFIAPYQANLNISILSKFLQLQHYNNKYCFLPQKIKVSLADFLFVDEYFYRDYVKYK